MFFDEFIKSLRKTNANLNTLVDFEKVSNNVKSIEIKLTQLNYLIGKEDLKSAVHRLYIENPNCFSVLNILVAVRSSDYPVINGEAVSCLNDFYSSPDKIFDFLVITGLADLLKSKSLKNLVDYVFGIEVGLDSNARKNRTGKSMEKTIADIFSNANINFETQVKNTLFPELIGFGVDTKHFDFIVRTNKKTYFIEVNYYNSGGSKLNEVARSYTELAPKINK